jgi:hypothetical protein
MSGAHGYALTAGGATTAENRRSRLRLHARPKAVCFHAVAAIGLKCTLGHVEPLLFLKKNLRVSSIFEYIVGRAGNPAELEPRHAASHTITMRHYLQFASSILKTID